MIFCSLLTGTSIQEGKAIIQDALDQFENPTHIAVKCTAGLCLKLMSVVKKEIFLQKKEAYNNQPFQRVSLLIF